MQIEKPKQTRACSLKDLRPDFAKAVQKYVSAEEEILACYETTGTATDIVLLFDVQTPVYSAQIISRKQLVLGWSSNNSYTIQAIQLRDIVSITEHRYDNGYWIYAEGQGETRLQCSFASPQTSQDFAGILQKAVEQEKSASTLESQKLSLASIEERMETLTRLHKNGLIDDVEFQEKRKELLNQI